MDQIKKIWPQKTREIFLLKKGYRIWDYDSL